MKFGQLIEYSKRNIFLKKLFRKWDKETSSKPLFFKKKKSFILDKSKWPTAWFHYISINPQISINRNKLFETYNIDPEICSILFFLDNGLGINSSTRFVYGFSTKIFLILYSINWSNFIVSWPLLLELLGYMCLLTRFWRHKCQNEHDLSNQAIFMHGQESQDRSLKILGKKRAFKVK